MHEGALLTSTPPIFDLPPGNPSQEADIDLKTAPATCPNRSRIQIRAPPPPSPPGNPSQTADIDLKTARALNSAYKGLGVTAADIGTYGKKQADLGCKAYTPTGGQGILAVTDAKDSLRPTAAAPKAPAAKAPAAKAAGRRLL